MRSLSMLHLFEAGAVVCAVYFLRHILGGMVGLFRIVPPNEAHIRVLKNRKDIFSIRSGKTSYWFIPFITKLNRLPLHNLTIPVGDIKLNDKNMAKFQCDLVCFVNIKDLNLAVERLVLSSVEKEMGFDFVRLSDDFRSIMESIGRTVVTKQTILDIYMNRHLLSDAITKEVASVFPKWGIELVNLELKHIKDTEHSTIISDIERKVAAEIRRDAEIKVSETTREAEIAKAQNEEVYRKRQIEKDQAVGIAEQQMNQQISAMKAEANLKEIEALSRLEVGKAEIERQKIERLAEAEKAKMTLEADGQANHVKAVGQAEADVIRIKKEADAAGTLKLAEALKQFNETALSVKQLDIQRDVLIEKFRALSAIAKEADIRWIMSGQNAQSFFGLNLDAQGGANLEQFLKESGIDPKAVIEAAKKTAAPSVS
ncbi:MAG: hypothetical protein MOGMAGMI_02194 [Candidatus Omnitrophica bacterium]|nr:hypothetical protein [Candidatus Omnitrophota bacterium]